MTVAIPLAEQLDARANAVESLLEVARVEMERNRAFAGVAAYSALSRHQLRRFRSLLYGHWRDVSDGQLIEFAHRLERGPRVLGPALSRAERHLPKMRVFERWVLQYVRASLEDVQMLIEQLKLEAAKGQASALADGPMLSTAMRRQAVMATTVLRHVKPDPAEAHPDPDYGL